MNAPGVGYALQKGEAIAHEERYQLLTQKVAYLFKGVPLSSPSFPHSSHTEIGRRGISS